MVRKPEQYLNRLILRLARRDWPGRMHFVQERGYVPEISQAALMQWPRLNVCLRGKAVYRVRGEGGVRELALGRGDGVCTLPGCALAPFAGAEYISLGLVFHPEMTRFLLGHNSRSHGHRFLLVHHAPAPLGTDGWHAMTALENCRSEPPEALLPAALGKVVLLLAARTLEAGGQVTGKATLTWQAACHFLEENLHRPLGRQEVADFLQVHPNHLARLFRRFCGESFNTYVRNLRLQRSRELLEVPGMNVGQVARACGYTDPNYFIRCYRDVYGHTPGAGRNRPSSP
ncbi:MAG: AraC family transcriptional regulator [Verrucomicrobiota bacterium JB024]|nr:AraC family transcriptional regulator [Verrucomicrobiota bacterium JB024]